MSVFIKVAALQPSGETLGTIAAHSDWSVALLKRSIEEKFGIPREAQDLLMEDMTLRDTRLLSDFCPLPVSVSSLRMSAGTVEVTLVTRFLGAERWKQILADGGRWEEILKYVLNGTYSTPSEMRTVVHELWEVLGAMGDEAKWSNGDFVQRAVEQEVSLLALASPEVKKDRKLMLRLVKQFARALAFVDPQLQHDWDFALEAIGSNFFAVQSLSPQLLEDPRFVQKAQHACPIIQHVLAVPPVNGSDTKKSLGANLKSCLRMPAVGGWRSGLRSFKKMS